MPVSNNTAAETTDIQTNQSHQILRAVLPSRLQQRSAPSWKPSCPSSASCGGKQLCELDSDIRSWCSTRAGHHNIIITKQPESLTTGPVNSCPNPFPHRYGLAKPRRGLEFECTCIFVFSPRASEQAKGSGGPTSDNPQHQGEMNSSSQHLRVDSQDQLAVSHNDSNFPLLQCFMLRRIGNDRPDLCRRRPRRPPCSIPLTGIAESFQIPFRPAQISPRRHIPHLHL